jgi:hypothetical protein
MLVVHVYAALESWLSTPVAARLATRLLDRAGSLGAGQHESADRRRIEFLPVNPCCASIHTPRPDSAHASTLPVN